MNEEQKRNLILQGIEINEFLSKRSLSDGSWKLIHVFKPLDPDKHVVEFKQQYVDLGFNNVEFTITYPYIDSNTSSSGGGGTGRSRRTLYYGETNNGMITALDKTTGLSLDIKDNNESKFSFRSINDDTTNLINKCPNVTILRQLNAVGKL